MENAWSSQNAFLIIEQNDAQCPVLDPDGLTPLGTGEYTFANGVVYVGGVHPAPYDSFANFIIAFPNSVTWIFDEDTGEGRYYDGTQAGDDALFWPPEKRAIGKCQAFKPSVVRPLEFQNAVGDMRAVDVIEGTYETNVSMDKTMIDKRRLDIPIESSGMDSLFGFMGAGPLERELYEVGVRNHNYLVIQYIKDLSSDIDNVARAQIFPCTKFGEIQPQSTEGRIIRCTLQGKATYMKSVPNDSLNIDTYTQVDIFEPCELKVLIDNAGVNLGTIGQQGGIEKWEGQEWTTGIIMGFDTCTVYQKFSSVVLTPADIVCRIYAMAGGIPVGPALLTSTQYTPAQVQASVLAGINHAFEFPARPPLFGTYFASLETVGASPNNNFYEPLFNNADPYAAGNRWVATNAPWAALSVADYAEVAGTDLRMEIWGLKV